MVLNLPSRSQVAHLVSVRQRRYRWLLWLTPVLAACLFLAYREVRSALAQPRIAFVLGGLEQREQFAAHLAQSNPELEIWVSSGSPEDYLLALFEEAGIARDRVYLNYDAQDTVTNFTTLADRLRERGADSVYLITSANHMPRARLVGEIVFGSRGIAIKPLAVPSDAPPEPIGKLVRDGARALLWAIAGSTGEEFIEIAPEEFKVLADPDQ